MAVTGDRCQGTEVQHRPHYVSRYCVQTRSSELPGTFHRPMPAAQLQTAQINEVILLFLWFHPPCLHLSASSALFYMPLIPPLPASEHPTFSIPCIVSIPTHHT
eukprot:364081-Chlamydomonas_euryale.AAC.10